MQTFVVPKNRRPKFELCFRIIDLNNVPLVSGTSSIKWHLVESNAADDRGRTPKHTIKDHKVIYDYEKTIQLRLVVGKDSVLQDSHLNFEVLQEYQTSGRSERITLGVIKLNLAEYVDTGQSDQAESGAITRRYLMQESKINSTLKIEIAMKHLEGDKNYTAPPLRTAPVFGGIAGIISSEAADAPEEGATVPSLSTKSRETGELQDTYRRTLAASWTAQPGEPRADDCIEDIFGGGDGWAAARASPRHARSSAGTTPTQSRVDLRDASDDDGDERRRGGGGGGASNLSGVFGGNRRHRWSPSKGAKRVALGYGLGHHHEREQHRRHGEGPGGGALQGGSVAGRTSLEQQARKMEKAAAHRSGEPSKLYIDEFDNPYKDDLRSWKIRTQG